MCRYRIILVLLVLASASSVMAVDTLQVTSPDPVLGQWRWTEFDRHSGLAGNVRNIYEDRDGNIWFGTDNGAQRYDGRTWTTYTTEDGLAGNRVSALTQTRDGAMWFGTAASGISRFDGQTWTTYTTEDGLASNTASWAKGLHQARDGTLWAGFGTYSDTTGTRSGISRFDGQTWTTVDVPGIVRRPTISYIHQTSDGDLWFATWSQGVLRFDGSTWTRYTTENGLAGNNVLDILEAEDGGLWFACYTDGISRFDGTHWRTYGEQDSLPESYRSFSLWQTEGGTVWSTGAAALYRFQNERWQTHQALPVRLRGTLIAHWTSNDRIWIWTWAQSRVFRFAPKGTTWTVYTDVPSSRLAETLASDNLFTFDNDVWLGGTDGAVRYTGDSWIKYTAQDGLIDGYISTILKDKSGALWFAGQHQGKSGAARYDGISWRIFTEADGLVGTGIGTGFAVANGDVWFGTKWGTGGAYQGGGVMRFDGQAWTVYTTEDGLLSDRIYEIGQTPDGTIWVGTYTGLNRFDGTQWTGHLPHPESDSPLEQKIRTLSATQNLWIGQAALDGGAARFDDATWTWYTIKNGLASDGVWEIFESRDGTVWAGTNAGLSRFDGTFWNTYSDDTSPGSLRFRSIGETSDGALWMRENVSGSPVVRYMPDRNAPETRLEPTVEQVSSAGNILLQWTGGDFWNDTPPDQLRFQFRMNDAPWSPISNQTAFTFTNLSDGTHRFEVRALDRDGNVDATPAIHQVEGSDRGHKGTGLGLSITKQSAELLGGSIGVESEVSKGSTFTVRVPVVYQEG